MLVTNIMNNTKTLTAIAPVLMAATLVKEGQSECQQSAFAGEKESRQKKGTRGQERKNKKNKEGISNERAKAVVIHLAGKQTKRDTKWI